MRKLFTNWTNSLGWNKKADEQPKFVDLAPTDEADKDGVYSRALLYATTNPRVSNIAITGPYGSGKSSIIKSFLKDYKRPVLQISLAAFLPGTASNIGDDTGKSDRVSKQEIERSILQQMLYGADANKLPLSRFKRIKSPSKFSVFISLYIIFGLFACWHLIQEREAIISGSYFNPMDFSNWFNLLLFAVGASFLVMAVHYLHVASFGVSLKSISLKDITITPISANQESILNRHLDEIIYFFQKTKYDLVIIEDLDRFNNPDIFVTLREINSLVNENAGVKRKIRFLYALRDDMFINTDRTKFFEFIIPVIPIINSSNSIDKVLEQGSRLSLNDRLDRQFLREVSRYLNDLRLIQNIFNEYVIYVENLDTVLDANKLLAVLIYKNVFPREFEDLHRGRGGLAQMLDRHDQFVAMAEARYKEEIDNIEKRIDDSEQEYLSNLQDLRRVYAMALIEAIPAQTQQVSADNSNWIRLSNLSTAENLEKFLSSDIIYYLNASGYGAQVKLPEALNKTGGQKAYQQRKEKIEQKSTDFKKASLARIRDLRDNITNLRATKFNELIRLNISALEEIFETFGENKELARFLILEGYLDDTYYQYTSLFHSGSGRLSPSDNKFLIQIRGFVVPEPDFQIDNPKEVIAAMRDEDFRQRYALNVKIVDCLLGNASTYQIQTQKLLELITSDFNACKAFFEAYYATGAEVSALLSGLVRSWEGFIPAAIASSENISHMSQIIARLPEEALAELPVKHPDLPDFVSSNLPDILSTQIDFEHERLRLLKIEIEDFTAIENYPGVARFLYEEGLYQITVANVEFLFEVILGQANLQRLRTQHYTTILGTENVVLISRIERDFELYVRNILLQLEENSQESAPAILSVINREEIDFDDLEAFLRQQSSTLSSLDQVPARLHALLFQLAMVEASWENCLAFLGSENFDAESLSDFLNLDNTLAVISQQPIPAGDEASELRKFLVEGDTLQDEAYRIYVRSLPKQFREFPKNLDSEKLRILIEENRIIFSEKSLAALDEDTDLKVLFVAKNIQQYLSDQSKFSFDDEFREKLLVSDIGDESKLAIIRSMDLSSLGDLPARAAIVGPILDRTGANLGEFGVEVSRAVIVNSEPIEVQVSLFNKCQNILSDEDVRETLAMLPKPFSEIKTGFNIPRIKKTEENLELVSWLDSRDIISSWSETYFSDEIRINLYRR